VMRKPGLDGEFPQFIEISARGTHLIILLIDLRCY
jgi:hypothetical protein